MFRNLLRIIITNISTFLDRDSEFWIPAIALEILRKILVKTQDEKSKTFGM